MEIELNTTLKGATVWKKGLILDDEKAPFPADLLREIELKTGTVRIIKKKPAEKKDDLLFRKFDEKKPVEEIVNIEDIVPDDEKKKKVTRSDVFRMNKVALIAFINDEEKTTDKTNKELKEMAYGII
jgi:hypothetical protein